MSMISQEFIDGQLPYIDTLTELGFVLRNIDDKAATYKLEREDRITVCVDQASGLATFWVEETPALYLTIACAGQAHTEAEIEPTFQTLMMRFMTGDFDR